MRRIRLKIYLVPSCIILIAIMILAIVGCKDSQERNPGAVYKYSKQEIAEQKQESIWTKKYYKFSTNNIYFDFLNQSLVDLTQPASTNSKLHFDSLYDNGHTPFFWTQFTDLNQALTSTNLSNQVKLNLDWNQLYQQVNLTLNEMMIADQQLLRFYNIIANLYGIDNVLKLVQNIKLNRKLTAFAITHYYPNISATSISLSQKFANFAIIREEYNNNRWSSSNPITATIHEYGHAIANYIINSEKQRAKFNTYRIADLSKNSFEKQLINLPSKIISNDQQQIFDDVTESLICFLNRFNIHNSELSPIKKMLFPFLVVNSQYSRAGWIVNRVDLREELFAEAFARWLGTDSDNRNFAWEILNHYFMDFFPLYFHLTS